MSKHELGDDAVGAGIDLGLEVVDVGLERRALGMLLGIAGDGDLEVADPLQAGHEIGGVDVAAGMGLVVRAEARRRIAAQRHDVANAGFPIGARDGVDFGLGGVDAGEMRRRPQPVSLTMRATVACVRSRVEPPAP